MTVVCPNSHAYVYTHNLHHYTKILQSRHGGTCDCVHILYSEVFNTLNPVQTDCVHILYSEVFNILHHVQTDCVHILYSEVFSILNTYSGVHMLVTRRQQMNKVSLNVCRTSQILYTD